MGDLMDEGSVASDDAFQRYLKRFHFIFKTSMPVHRIYIPGDNDIGGEGSDHVTPQKLNRFRETFNESHSVIVRKRFRFFNINLLTRKYPELNDSESSNKLLNIILSHISILSYPGITMKTVCYYK